MSESLNRPSQFSRATQRLRLEVDGYTWRIYGSQSGSWWRAHLVELVGSLSLDVAISQPFLNRIRSALAKALDVSEAEVKPITADLILA